MKEIDWSKAPEGATHYDVTFSIFCNENGFWNLSGFWVSDRRQIEWGSKRYVPRPLTWNGEGLPPFGTVCEARFSMECVGIDRQSEWVEIVPVAYGKNHIIYDHGGSELSAYLVGSNFRVIRTPEQIAAEEREKAIDEMVTLSPMLDKGWARKVCSAVYDAGYRKQEQPE